MKNALEPSRPGALVGNGTARRLTSALRGGWGIDGIWCIAEEDQAAAAREASAKVFRKGEVPEDIETREFPADPEGVKLPKLLASVGLVPSIRRFSSEKATGDRFELELSTGREYLFKVGKRRFLRLVVSG